MGSACSTNGEKRNAYRLLVGKQRSRLVDNIKMDIGEIRWGVKEWIDLAQDGHQ
jgi:hypothetical protein